jgi:hypothetical protein
MRAPARAAIGLALLAVVAGGAGCQTLTGRPVGRWIDDKTITARVKGRLTATGLASLTRVHVDTYDGRVYLTGAVARETLKTRIEELASTVPGVEQVVTNLEVAPGLVAQRAEADEPAVAALPRFDERNPLLERLKLARLVVESGTPAWTQYAAYDAEGRLAATVFSLRAAEMRQRGVAGLYPGDRPVDHVSIYPRAGADGAYYDVVLWHVPREDAAAGR